MDSKVAIIVNNFPSISETFIVRQAKYLDAHVVTEYLKKDVCQYYDFDYNQKVKVFSDDKRELSLMERLKNKALGIPCKLWKKEYHEQFEKFIKEENIKLVFAQFGPNGINALPVCQKLGIPLIVNFLGYDASSLVKNQWYRKEIKKTLDYAKTAVVLYNGMQQPFLDMGCDKNKIEVINVGVPIKDFQIIDIQKAEIFNFIAVGRFVEKKSPLSTIKAFELCAKENPAVHLNMIGNGVLFDEAKKYVAESEAKDKISLLGYLPQSELKKIYRNSHAYLQHSITASNGDKEGWPVGIAEACASGLPIIATRHAGINEQVIHEETGFLVNEKDYEEMGRYMLRLSRDWALCERMGKASRQHIESHGDIEKQIKKLKQIIEKQI